MEPTKPVVIASNWPSFTLLESMVALLALGGICLLFSSLLSFSQQANRLLVLAPQKDWEVFALQLDYETREYRLIEVTSRKLVFEKLLPVKPNQSKYVEIYHKERVLRKKDNGGYHPLLTEVASTRFVKGSQSIVVEVTFLDGREATLDFVPETTTLF